MIRRWGLVLSLFAVLTAPHLPALAQSVYSSLGGMAYQNASSVAITGGSITGATFNNGAIGGTTASSGAFTTLSASSTVSGTGFSTYLASPPAIGGTAAAAGTFTTITGTGATITTSGVDATISVNSDASNNASLGLNGANVSGKGPYFSLTRNSTVQARFGTSSAVLGGTSNDAVLYAGGGNGITLASDGGVAKFTLTSTGHRYITNTGTLSPSGCGTSPTVEGNDNVGKIVAGAGGYAAGSCGFAWLGGSGSWTNLPVCNLANLTAKTLVTASPSSTGLIFDQAAAANDVVVWNCTGY